MGEDVAANAPNVVIAAVALLLFFALGRAVRALVARVGRTRRKHRNYTLVLGRLAQGLVTVFGVLVACVIVLPNFTPASLVSFLGIGSVAIGFAFRDVLQNYLAGILLLLTEPFRIGDQIVFGEFEGTVENIETRATFIRTYDGRRVVVPNAELFTNAVMVNTAFEKRRLEYDVGVGYGDDVDRAKALILEAMRRVDGVLAEPPPDVLTMELAESAVALRARWWIEPPAKASALDARDQVLAAIKRTLQDHGIDLPFPTRQVLFHDQTEEADGDRGSQREGWPAARGGDAPRSRRLGEVVAEALRRSPSAAAMRREPGRSRRKDI
jgi:small conductance mechanosensitive channel